MTSLPKTMGNSDLPETMQMIYHLKGHDESCPQIYFSLSRVAESKVIAI